MSNENAILSSELINFLQGERIVTLVTIDKETNKPTCSTISWLIAKEDQRTIKFAVGHNASSAENIMENPNVLLNVIGPDSSYEISGTGEVSEIYKGKMKFRVVTVDAEAVNDIMFYGGKITSVPSYEKTYDMELAKQLDSEIYEKLKQ
ncbi:pyridoxamine 5'-phosphate oxidase family protein [Alkalihalobacterium alkalinitrilicum]|uniref:pyridoxamine 5'-phosphate oxidase family protein n=1 Tax=Alkalihalobacterium alkalinitrilicum TaxID=427920 RepID=UPI000994CF85|nr:pyridoxamine 5'-phosphate oxidase family protein [Alkalihalobacterium alkalinitrilicum]